MDEAHKEFALLVSAVLPIPEPIYELGSFQVPGQIGFADLRPFFPSKKYVGADMREGPGVDIVLDLHDIDLPSASVGTVLCLSTLEHVEDPRRALQEIHRILIADGMAVISSTMNFPIHDYPSDYWRFTPEAFKSLLSPFAHSFVGCAGRSSFPHTVVGIGFKGSCPSLTGLEKGYKQWRLRHDRTPMTFSQWVRAFIVPPVFSRKARKNARLSSRRPDKSK